VTLSDTTDTHETLEYIILCILYIQFFILITWLNLHLVIGHLVSWLHLSSLMITCTS